MRFKNVTKMYGNNIVLKDFSLSLEEGKITALLGESGAGKTTLLNVAAGLTDYQGECDIADCSYVFQEPRLLPNLTVEGNLKFVLSSAQYEEIDAMLQKVGMLDKKNRYPHQLSGGEKKRVAIARAFLYPHHVLLMDEPFSSLDVSLQKDLTALVVQLWQERKNTILFVTHNVQDALLLAHRAIVLKQGRIALDLPIPYSFPREFLKKYPEEETLILSLLDTKT